MNVKNSFSGIIPLVLKTLKDKNSELKFGDEEISSLFSENEEDEENVTINTYSNILKIIEKRKEKLLAETLQNGDNSSILNEKDRNGASLIHHAALTRNPEILKCLLNAGWDTNCEDLSLKTPMHYVVLGGCRCESCGEKSSKCIEILFEKEARIDVEDAAKKTPLFYATENMLPKCARVMLDFGSDIGKTYDPDKTKTIGQLLVQKIPEVLIGFLNKGIIYNEVDNSKLKLDFGIILQSTENEITAEDLEASMTTTETNLLNYIFLKAHRSGLELLLTHPLSEAFIHLKWNSVSKFFLMIRLFYLALTIAYTVFIFKVFLSNCPWTYADPMNNTNCEQNTLTYIMGGLVAIWVLAMILNEMHEVYNVGINKYLKDGVNYAWWTLIVVAFLSMLPAVGVEPFEWQYPMAGFGVFMSWSMNIVQVGRIPMFGVYVEMLGKVLRDFFIFSFTYASLIFAFALGFCIIFPENEFFSSIPLSLVKTLLLMLGEPDYDGLLGVELNPRADDYEYTIPAHIYYVGFIVIISIVLMNLLLGLAVSDIQQLQEYSNLSRITRQVKQIALFESLLYNQLLPVKISKLLIRYFSILRKIDGRYFHFSPTDPHDNGLPEELKQKFIPYLTTSPCLNKKSMRGIIKANIPKIVKTTHKGVWGISQNGNEKNSDGEGIDLSKLKRKASGGESDGSIGGRSIGGGSIGGQFGKRGSTGGLSLNGKRPSVKKKKDKSKHGRKERELFFRILQSLESSMQEIKDEVTTLKEKIDGMKRNDNEV